MASLEKRSGGYLVDFRFGGQKYSSSLRTKDKKAAVAPVARLEDNLRRVELGTPSMPDDTDVVSFLLSDGKINAKPTVKPKVTLEELIERFFESLPEGSLEDTTLYGMNVHKRHLLRVLGKRFVVQNLTLAHLQTSVSKRSKEPGKSLVEMPFR